MTAEAAAIAAIGPYLGKEGDTVANADAGNGQEASGNRALATALADAAAFAAARTS